MDIKKLESYAELIVRVGANVQKGQDVVISISRNLSKCSLSSAILQALPR